MSGLVDEGPLLFLMLALSVFGVVHIVDQVAWRIRRNGQKTYGRPSLRVVRSTEGPADSSDQLRWVMSASFTARKIMSLAEYRVFKEVEAEVRAKGGGFRVFAQTSLGEIIGSDDRRAHSAINSKRVDVLVVGPSGLPVLAVEYQGQGHYQGDAAARDAVKKEALRRAGVRYVEVLERDGPEDIRRMVRDIIGAAAA